MASIVLRGKKKNNGEMGLAGLRAVTCAVRVTNATDPTRWNCDEREPVRRITGHLFPCYSMKRKRVEAILPEASDASLRRKQGQDEDDSHPQRIARNPRAPAQQNGTRHTPRKNARSRTVRVSQIAEQAGDYSEEDELLPQDSSEDDELGSDSKAEDEADDRGQSTTTPTKRGRGRPPSKQKASRRKRTPTPPPDMPPYEQYFFQNRPGGLKTSNNTLSSLSLLSHEDFYDAMRKLKDPHQDEMDYLHHLHGRSFDQWLFELEEDFSLCLYGWGSKRLLLSALADHIASASVIEGGTPSKIVMVNGFNPTLTVRDILSTIAGTIGPLQNTKLGAQPVDMLSNIIKALDVANSSVPVYLLIHSMDAPPLRRIATQSILARLAHHPLIRLAFTVDTPTFPLLWDARLRSQFNILFHDSTTFQRFSMEINVGNGGGGVVDEVNSLLGRSGRRVHGREGVVFVLRSLTESARRLFGLLVAEVLSLDADTAPTRAHFPGIGATADDGDDDEDNQFEQAVSGKKPGETSAHGELGGVEYRALYRKAVQQLITGNEISFRQLLKEFYDHQMVVSRRDGMGTEVLGVPFRREECEAILEDLVIDE